MVDVPALLEKAAARPTGPAPVDAIARGAARRRRNRRAATGAALLIALAALGFATLAIGGDGGERVEYVGDPPDTTAAAWTRLAGLVPDTGWDRPVTFGSDGALVAGSFFGGSRDREELRRSLQTVLGVDTAAIRDGVVTMTPPHDVLIASGTFDLDAIDQAVRADPDWSGLLTVKEFEGESFYSWGGDYAIEGDPSPLRPLGRGGRLLVRDDLFVFTRGDAEMHEIIEKLVAGPAPPDRRFEDVTRAAARRSMTSMTYLPPGLEWPGTEPAGPGAPAVALANDSDGTETDTSDVREVLLLAFVTPGEAEQAAPRFEEALEELVTPEVEVTRAGAVVELASPARGFWLQPQGEGSSALAQVIDAATE